jgi:hypothetical protein
VSGSDVLVVLAFLSPLPAGTVCVVYYLFAADRLGIGYKASVGRFLGRFFTWAAIGFGAAVAGGALWSGVSGKMGAMLVAVLILGPLAVSIGMIVGTVRWRLRVGS